MTIQPFAYNSILHCLLKKLWVFSSSFHFIWVFHFFSLLERKESFVPVFLIFSSYFHFVRFFYFSGKTQPCWFHWVSTTIRIYHQRSNVYLGWCICQAVQVLLPQTTPYVSVTVAARHYFVLQVW